MTTQCKTCGTDISYEFVQSVPQTCPKCKKKNRAKAARTARDLKKKAKYSSEDAPRTFTDILSQAMRKVCPCCRQPLT